MRKLRVLVRYEHGSCRTPFGAAYIRLLRPLSHPSIADAFDVAIGDDPSCRGMDVVIADRMWKPGVTTREAMQLVDQARQAEACLIYSLDDNLLDLNDITIEQKAVVGLLAREADGMIVSTAPLKARFREMNRNIEVVPNALDERLFGPALAREKSGSKDRKRQVIGYMGTFTHDDDVRMIAASLRSVLERRRDRIEFQLVGAVHDPATLGAFGDLPVRVLELNPADMEYPAFVAWMISHMRFDIGIAPLRANDFTRCKSDIKYLDYGALGIPGIYSRIPAYDQTVRHLETGYLADNVPEAWEEGLNRLLDDHPLRQSMARNVQEEVFSARTLQHCAKRWQAAIHAIVEKHSCCRGRSASEVAIQDRADGTAVDADNSHGVADVDLILGVHNEPHLASNCIESLLANTNYPDWRLLIVDDQSDEVTRTMLEGYASQHANIIVHRNETNLGFVGTYNRGIALAKAKYVVFVNSDIIVPPGWLGRLVDVAEADPSIALVNPLSNEAANLSVPMAPGTSCLSLDKLLNAKNDKQAFDIVTAIGFCLLVRREALERHGSLDDAFGRGYCEDSDLHMRLTSHGWRSVAAPNTYVYHLGSGTFSASVTQQRYEENITIFMERWESRWREDLRRFCEADPLAGIRGLFQIELPSPPPPPLDKKKKIAKALRLIVQNRNKLISALLRPRRALTALRMQINAMPPPPPPPPPPVDVVHTRLPRHYLERNTPRDMPSVIFILEGLQTGGGCLRVVELANQLILSGINARVAVCDRGLFDPEIVRGALFTPMLFDNHDDLLLNLPDCDVVVATLWSTAAYARKLVDAGRAQAAFHFLQDFEPWFYDTEEERQQVVAAYPLVENRIATSHWLRNLVREHGYDAKVIPLGFDALRFYRRSTEASERIRIIAMARPETPRRGFEDVVEAFRLVRQQRPEVEFALFGSRTLDRHGDLGFPYADLGIIHDRNQLCRQYSNSDIFLDASRFQGFGLPALEAMACNVACVLTDVGGVHEYARDGVNALMVPSGNPEACCNAIVRLVDNPRLRMQLGDEGRRTVERMSPKNEAAAWINAMAEICPVFQGVRVDRSRHTPCAVG